MYVQHIHVFHVVIEIIIIQMSHQTEASNNKFETTLKCKADEGEDEYSLGGLVTNEMEMASLQWIQATSGAAFRR